MRVLNVLVSCGRVLFTLAPLYSSPDQHLWGFILLFLFWCQKGDARFLVASVKCGVSSTDCESRGGKSGVVGGRNRLIMDGWTLNRRRFSFFRSKMGWARGVQNGGKPLLGEQQRIGIIFEFEAPHMRLSGRYKTCMLAYALFFVANEAEGPVEFFVSVLTFLSLTFAGHLILLFWKILPRNHMAFLFFWATISLPLLGIVCRAAVPSILPPLSLSLSLLFPPLILLYLFALPRSLPFPVYGCSLLPQIRMLWKDKHGGDRYPAISSFLFSEISGFPFSLTASRFFYNF